MPKARPPYPPEYRQQMSSWSALAAPRRSWPESSNLPAQCIRNWIKEAEREEGLRSDGPTSAEREELKRLRRENKILRQEKDILKKPRPNPGLQSARGREYSGVEGRFDAPAPRA